jgi:hypothetical protein
LAALAETCLLVGEDGMSGVILMCVERMGDDLVSTEVVAGEVLDHHDERAP